ncbi:MAG: ABC transporter ATP-binding protein [Atopobiaceae bacterium]
MEAGTDSTLPEYGMREIVHTLAQSLREYRKYAWNTPLLVSGEAIIECIIPFFTAQLINQIAAGEPLGNIVPSAIILICLALASLAFGTAAGVTCSIGATGLAKNLRHDLFHKIQGFSFANIDRFSTSSLVTRLTTDVTNVQQAYMMIIRTAIRCPMLAIFSIIMAFISGGPMAVIYVIVAFFLGYAIFKIALTAMPIFRRIFRKYDRLNDSVEENVSGIRVVKSYVREDYEKQKFDDASGTLYHDFVHVERILAWNTPLMTLAVDIIYTFVIYFGSQAIISSQAQAMGVGQLSALITYGFSLLMSLMMFSMVFVMITMAEESSRRICEVLKEEPTLSNPEHPLMEVPDGSVDFDHVSFEYSEKADRMALTDIDLHIKSGEVIGILGGTGSSKSTLIQLISRLYDATEGTVKVGGHDVRDYDLDTLRNEVAVVLQRNVLFSGTIKDNLRWGNPNATDEQMIEACKLAQADEFIQRFPDKYDTYIEQGGTNVSGGQKQRLCIARALLKNPKVLILDDSTSAVDTKTDRLIRQGFRSFIPSTTKIIIAQRTSSIEDADRIVVMRDGQIDDIGTHDELLRRNDIYREVYLTQNKQSHDEKMSALEKSADAGKEA